LLGHFDVILILEEKKWLAPLIETMLGWYNESDLDRRHGRRGHGPGRELSDEDRKTVAEANAEDVEVSVANATIYPIHSLLFFSCHHLLSDFRLVTRVGGR
jgi:hypothetical protein